MSDSPATNERLGVNEEAIRALRHSDNEQWEAIRKLQNRLPIWATTLISVLTFALGCVSTYAVMLANGS